MKIIDTLWFDMLYSSFLYGLNQNIENICSPTDCVMKFTVRPLAEYKKSEIKLYSVFVNW